MARLAKTHAQIGQLTLAGSPFKLRSCSGQDVQNFDLQSPLKTLSPIIGTVGTRKCVKASLRSHCKSLVFKQAGEPSSGPFSVQRPQIRSVMKVKKTSASGNELSSMDAIAQGPSTPVDHQDTQTLPIVDDTAAPMVMSPEESLGALTPAPDSPSSDSRASDLAVTSGETEPAPLFAPQSAPPSKKQKTKTTAPSTFGLGTYLLAALASALWIGGLLAFAVGFQSQLGVFAFDPFTLAVFGFLALAPVGLIGFSAFAFNQGARFAREAERAKRFADDLTRPVSDAGMTTGSVVTSIRSAIDGASDAASRVHMELTTLREGLAEETRRLLEAANESVRTTQHITQVMSEEREALGRVAQALDHQADRVVDNVERQARMVAEASDLAETQLREAEATLTARAADLTTAASDANHNTQLAGTGLEIQIVRLETASRLVKDQMSDADLGLDRQRNQLSATIDTLKFERERFEQVFTERQDQLASLVSQSLDAAQSVTRSVTDASQQFDSLSETSQDRADALSEAARQHRAAIASAAVDSLSALTDASLRHRDMLLAETQYMIQMMVQAADEARLAAEDQMANVRGQLDQLGEASFTAGQQAEAMFEARLNEARSLIEQSARLAEEAGSRSSEQLTEGLVSTRAVVSEFAELLASLEARMAKLPQDTARQAQIVTSSLSQGLVQGIEDLTHAARRAAEDSQTFDVEFQDRVRRNYEALGLAVMQLESMGKRRPATAAPPMPVRPRAPLSTPLSASLARPVAGRPVMRAPVEAPVKPEPSAPAAPPLATRPWASLEESLPRTRLKLTPTAEPTMAPAPTPTPRPAPDPEPELADDSPEGSDQWTWKQLLTALEDDFVEDEQLGPTLAQEIQTMKIDTQSLLPRVSVEQIAALINTGDYDAALERVNALAQNSIRRLAKRLQSDKGLMTKAERFVEIQSNIIVEAASRDKEGFLMPTLLSNELGRAYLLYAAALAETE